MAAKRTLRVWEVKNQDQPKQYQTALGSTDYDIPMFGYRSAFLVLGAVFGSILLVPLICSALSLDWRLWTVVLSGVIGGFSIGYAQFFIERKKGLCRNFWIVSILMGLCISLIVFIGMYSGWLL